MSSSVAGARPIATGGIADRSAIVLAAVLIAVLAGLFAPSRAHAAFGVSQFVAEVRNQDGTLYKQAGGHPFVGVTDFSFNTTATGAPDGNVKEIRVDVPPGLISNPEATPKCTDAQFPACPPSSQL